MGIIKNESNGLQALKDSAPEKRHELMARLRKAGLVSELSEAARLAAGGLAAQALAPDEAEKATLIDTARKVALARGDETPFGSLTRATDVNANKATKYLNGVLDEMEAQAPREPESTRFRDMVGTSRQPGKGNGVA